MELVELLEQINLFYLSGTSIHDDIENYNYAKVLHQQLYSKCSTYVTSRGHCNAVRFRDISKDIFFSIKHKTRDWGAQL